MCGIDLGYDEAAIVPGWSREGSEDAEHDNNKHFRVDDVEKKHRGRGCKEAECYKGESNVVMYKIMYITV